MPSRAVDQSSAPPVPGQAGPARSGWSVGRIAALAAGILLGVLSAGLLAGGVYAVCADLGHWNSDSATMSWWSGELLTAAVFTAVPAVLLVVVPLRLAAGRDDPPRGFHDLRPHG